MNKLYSILGILFLTFFFSCQKAPINGDLDGQWEVMEVEPEPMETNIPTRIYYNFSLHVCALSYYGGTFAFANMTYTGDELYLDFPSIKDHERITLRQYGILSNPVNFKVTFSGKKNLVLSNDKSTVVLVKH